MGRIACVWELGGGMGHLQRLLPLALKMRERGHEIVCVVKHFAQGEKLLGNHGIRVLQAPVIPIKVHNRLPNTFNYAQTLMNLGYLVEESLFIQAKAWRNLFAVIKPDLLVADHSPTALIAARGAGFKAVLYGTGFFAPPRQNPMPSMIPWIKTPQDFLAQSEKKVTAAINGVLTRLQAPQLESLADLFAVEENFLATIKELDHYQIRVAEKYWLPVLNLPEGDSPVWPDTGSGRKVFCYLKPNYPYLEQLLQALQQIQASVICFIPGLPGKIEQKFEAPNINFAARPLNMQKVCEACSLVVCHAGHGTMAHTLMYGKPLVLLPEKNQLEQILISQHVARLHAGVIILTEQDNRDYRGTMERVLSEPRFTEEAEKIARKYRDFDPPKQLDDIADRCEEIMQSS